LGLAAGRGLPPRRAAQPSFRDTVLYLLLRRLAADGQALTDTWDARSVDTTDLPGFFDRYSGGALQSWLAELSQGRAGDFRSGVDDVLAGHTRLAREAVQHARLVIANHALLFSNVSAFDHSAGTTLLLVDEAHRVEDAATSTFEASFDSAAVEVVAADLARYRDVAAGSDEQRAVLHATIGRLDEFLDAEQLPKAVGYVVDVHSSSDLLPGRQLRRGTIAAAEVDAITLRRGETVFGPLSTLRTTLSDCWQALDALPQPAEAAARDLHHGLRSRVLDTLLTVATVRRDLGALLGLQVQSDELGSDRVADELGVDVEQPPADASNRVVWAGEAPSPDFAARGWRWFRFAVTSSPVTLADEPRYNDFRTTFPASVFVSATLQVADSSGGQSWTFIRDRLGLDESVDAVALGSPFDPATQARLVCFEDFPSWAEQAEGAVRALAHQLTGYAREVIGEDGSAGAMLLTTSRAAAAEISDLLLRSRASNDGRYDIHSAVLTDNRTAVDRFKSFGGILTGTKGLWQGVDIDQPERLRLVWINKLPFPAVGDPVLEQRMARLRSRAEAAGAPDPDAAGITELYLPLAAIDLRQAVGRLLRSNAHRGVVVISDAKLAGNTVLRRTYRQTFLGSLDPGFRHQPGSDEPGDPTDAWGGNVVPMETGWQRIFTFLAEQQVIGRDQAEQLCQPDRLAEHVWLPQTRTVREQALSVDEEAALLTTGELKEELLRRAAKVGGALRLSDHPVELKPKQIEALASVARGDDLLAVLPTGYGKSFTFQLPALVLPGVTLVLSPLVSLMTDQALHLNRTIGGAVRALTGPMRESNSRLGKAEVAEQLTDPDARHGIRLIYISPERLAHRQFRDQVREAVRLGIVRRIAVDEAHTLAQWGDDFRPQFRRAERFVRELRRDPDLPRVQLLAVTATATRTVREHLRRWLFDHADPSGDAQEVDGFSYVTANPVRSDLAVYRRQLPTRDWAQAHYATVGIVEQVLEQLDGHAIVYAMTVREVDSLHGYLHEQAGTTRTVLRYHGRMPETEKTAVADAFINAPRVGDDGFKPMVVVATAAFGLGVDRPDIRAVLLASPPMDLAALYQQLGRAGRDQVGSPPEKLDKPAIGMALLTGRGWSTLRFFLDQRPEREQVLTQIAERILTSTDPYLDPTGLAVQVMDEEVTRGLLNRSDLDNTHVRSAYRTMVLRVFAALASSGHVEDDGDFPMRVTVTRGQISVGDAAQTASAILEAVGTGRNVALLDVWARLDAQLRTQLGDPGALWTEMSLLHAAGYLDVSQKANIGYGMTTGYRKLRGTVDPDLPRTLLAHLRTSEAELADLRAWFDPAAGHCVNDDLAGYFAVEHPPEGTCSVQANRCSTCWGQAAVAEEAPPPLHTAFFVHDPAPASKVASHRRSQQARLDATVTRLAKLHRRGFGRPLLKSVLRGEPTFWSRRGSMEVFTDLRMSRYYGSHPGLTDKSLDAAIDRLTTAGILGRNQYGGICHSSHLELDAGAAGTAAEAAR
jgi:RecQ family ATP-dependent DNA helicase